MNANYPILYRSYSSIHTVDELQSNGAFYTYYRVNIDNLLYNSEIVLKQECESTINTRIPISWSTKTSYDIKISFTNCTNGNLTQTLTTTFNNSDCFQGNLRYFKFGHNGNHCQQGFIQSPLKILGAHTIFYDNYTQNTDNSISARPNAESHSVSQIGEGDPIKMVSYLTSPKEVLVNYSPNGISQMGDAQNDTFNTTELSKLIRKIHLSQGDDTLIVNMTEAPDMEAILADGNDKVTCYSRCTLYLGSGQDTVTPINATTIIKDFNMQEDFIDLTRYTNLKDYTQISFNFISSNQSLILIFQGWQIVIQGPGITSNLTKINFKFSDVPCEQACPNCTVEQCTVCKGCEDCDGTSCSFCKYGLRLQNGKCQQECNFQIQEKTTQDFWGYPQYFQAKVYDTCYPCYIRNCQECTSNHVCGTCKDMYYLKNNQCLACPPKYYSEAGATQCTICEESCANCNGTYCHQCETGYTRTPGLNPKRCYLDIERYQCSLISSFNSTKQISTSLGEVLGDCGVTLDGSIVKLSHSLHTNRTNNIQSPQLMPNGLKRHDVNHKSCSQLTSTIEQSYHVQDLNKLIDPNTAQSQLNLNKLSLVLTVQRLYQVPNRIEFKRIQKVVSKLTVAGYKSLSDQEGIFIGDFVFSFTLLLAHLDLQDNNGKSYQTPNQTVSLLKEVGALITTTNYFTENLKNIGFKDVTVRSQFSQETFDKDLEDINKPMILQIKGGDSISGPRHVLCLSNIQANNQVQVYDPREEEVYDMSINQIESYIVFDITNMRSPFNLNALQKQIQGIPFYHVILTFEKGQDKVKYILHQWTQGFGVNQTFTVQDMTVGGGPKSVKFIHADGSILTSAHIYMNNDYAIDFSNYLEKSECTDRELKNFIGTGQLIAYNNSYGQYRICYEDQLTSSELSNAQSLTLTEKECQNRFWSRYPSTLSEAKSKLQQQVTNARACGYAKYMMIFGQNDDLISNSSLQSMFANQDFETAAFTLLNSKQMCSLHPRKTLEVFFNIWKNQGPVQLFSESLQATKQLPTDQELTELIAMRQKIGSEIAKQIQLDNTNDITQTLGKSGTFVRIAIQRAFNISDNTRWGHSYQISKHLEKHGFVPRDGLSEAQAFQSAQIGDVIVLFNKEDKEWGHAQVRCIPPQNMASVKNRLWCSDHFQAQVNPYSNPLFKTQFTLYRLEYLEKQQ